MNINDFIAEKYYVKFVGNGVQPDNLSSAKEFILTYSEKGNIESPDYEEMNALFINTFAQKNDIVLIENPLPNRKIQPHKIARAMWLGDGIDIRAWYCNSDEIPHFEEFNKYIEMINESSLIIKEILTCHSPDEKEVLEEKLWENMKELLKLPEENIQEKIKKFVPSRVLSMVSALEQSSEKAARVFLIATEDFFQEVPKERSLNSYDSLHETLEKRNVVVLKPKRPDFTQYFREREALIKKMTEKCEAIRKMIENSEDGKEKTMLETLFYAVVKTIWSRR
jgi:hypothetical protein